MKITVASSGLGHIARGIEAWAADLARELARRGLAVKLCKGGGVAEQPYERVIPCWQREAPGTQRLLRMIPRWLGWRLGIGSGYGIEQTTFALNLLQHLRQENVDILHVQDPQVALIVQRANQLGWVRTRAILGHGTEEPLSFLEKIQYLQHLAPWHEEQARAAGVWKPTWTAIPNFIDTERFRPDPAERRRMRAELAIPEDALVVLTVAAIKRHHKRIDYLLDELARLRTQSPELPVWLVIAGGWEKDTDQLMDRGRDLLGERVRFRVRFPRERMPQLYQAADAFVLTSLREMMPIALLEAAACALPYVVHRDPVLQWLTGPGGQPADLTVPGALADSLRRLLLDPKCRHRLGCEARDHCASTFGTAAVVDRVLEYYRFVRTHDRLPAQNTADAVVSAARPRISVVIPTYNSGAMMTEAIDSVVAQTAPADEIIVVDDGSTDDTADRLRRYGKQIIHVSQANQGVAAARNRGTRESTGDLIAFLDADDAWHPRKLELQLEVMSENRHLGLLGTDVYDWPAPDYPNVPDRPAARVATVPWRNLVVRNHFTTSSVIVRRDVLERLEPFDTDLHGPEDHDLWLRVAEVAPVGNLLLPLTGYRHVAGSLSQRAATMEAGMRRILQKVEQRGGWRGRPLLRRKAFSYLEYACAYLNKSANPAQALGHIYRSLLKYPMPYRPSEVRVPLARLRLVLALWRQLGRTVAPLDAARTKEINCG